LQITEKWKPQQNQKKDFAVMEALTKTGKYTAKNTLKFNQSLHNIPPSLLHLQYIHIQRTRNHSMSTEGKARRSEEVDLGMASSTTANLL
jgi:hypothetical protein